MENILCPPTIQNIKTILVACLLNCYELLRNLTTYLWSNTLLRGRPCQSACFSVCPAQGCTTSSRSTAASWGRWRRTAGAPLWQRGHGARWRASTPPRSAAGWCHTGRWGSLRSSWDNPLTNSVLTWKKSSCLVRSWKKRRNCGSTCSGTLCPGRCAPPWWETCRKIRSGERRIKWKPRAISAFEGDQVRNLLLQGGDSGEEVPCQTCSFNLQGPAQWPRRVSMSSFAEDGLDRCHSQLVTLKLVQPTRWVTKNGR